MSCPDWKRLAAHRESLDGTEPEGWQAALEHLDGGCKECRPRALAADPTLVFRRMPVLDLKPAAEVSEIESMRQAVAAMRTASRLEALDAGGRRGSFQGWRRWAAAAVLAVATLSLGSDNGWREQPAGEAAEGEVVSTESAFGGMVMPASLSTGAAGEAEPLLEPLTPAARVYEMSPDAYFIVNEGADV